MLLSMAGMARPADPLVSCHHPAVNLSDVFVSNPWGTGKLLPATAVVAWVRLKKSPTGLRDRRASVAHGNPRRVASPSRWLGSMTVSVCTVQKHSVEGCVLPTLPLPNLK